ncbi:MAG TPA: DUF971 domain-containing protein [Polyangiaceae bacterium]|jgi:DUF971 family protein|nr:DUF971 domain-containing protein [Polyangiaceae bacterium]
MSTDPSTELTGVKAPHGAHVLEISWADGRSFRVPHRLLRGYCPCAGCQGHGSGIEFQDAGDPELKDIGQVGNYALELGWSDGHTTGIYTYRYLRRLAELHAEHGDAMPERLPKLPDG